MIAAGEITDGKTVIGLLLALRAVESGRVVPGGTAR
jgi:hypothetical protein